MQCTGSRRILLSSKHGRPSIRTALPWASLIAAYTGMRLEEIAQLLVGDIRDQQANSATITVIDIHNGGSRER